LKSLEGDVCSIGCYRRVGAIISKKYKIIEFGMIYSDGVIISALFKVILFISLPAKSF
jgi:hypothetical protein